MNQSCESTYEKATYEKLNPMSYIYKELYIWKSCMWKSYIWKHYLRKSDFYELHVNLHMKRATYENAHRVIHMKKLHVEKLHMKTLLAKKWFLWATYESTYEKSYIWERAFISLLQLMHVSTATSTHESFKRDAFIYPLQLADMTHSYVTHSYLHCNWCMFPLQLAHMTHSNVTHLCICCSYQTWLIHM